MDSLNYAVALPAVKFDNILAFNSKSQACNASVFKNLEYLFPQLMEYN